MASFFTQSTEFTTRYGTLDEEGFIRLLYRNVLGREGEAGGIAFWTQQLNGRTMDRGTVLLRFAESPENIARSGTSQPILGPFNEGLSGPWTCAPALKTDCTPTISRSPWQVGAVMGPEWLLPEVPYPHLWVQADLSLYSDCGADRLLSTGAKAHLVTNGGQLRVGGEYLDLGVSLPCRMDYSGGPPREVTGVTGYSLDASVAPASIANIQPTEAECRALIAELGPCNIAVTPERVKDRSKLVISWRTSGNCYALTPGADWSNWWLQGTVDYQVSILPLTQPEGGQPRAIISATNSGIYEWDLSPRLNCPSGGSTVFAGIALWLGPPSDRTMFSYTSANERIPC